MLINESSDLLRMIKAISSTSALAMVEARADRPLNLRLEPGMEVRGEVVASLVNGRFLVRIAGDLLDMNLPSSVNPGDTLQFTFVSEKPRLTFSLGQQNSSGTPVNLSEAGRWLTLLARTPMGEYPKTEDLVKTIQASIKDAIFMQAQKCGEMPGSLNLAPGRQVQAEVVAKLPQGRFQVKVAGELLEMNLPKTARTGMELQLMFVTDKPQLLFAAAAPRQTSINRLMEAGRWLNFVGTVVAASSSNPPATLTGTSTIPSRTMVDTPLNPSVSRQSILNAATTTTPMASGGEVSASILTDKLRAALSQSGVFYESHIAGWAEGRIKLEELLKEPQGKLSSPGFPNAPPPGTDEPDLLSEGQKAQGSNAAVMTTARNASEPLHLADPQTLSIIRQQLELINSGIFFWKGEAWPGQEMEWTVGEREGGRKGPGRPWKTTLSLDLPRLGTVRFNIHLHESRLSVSAQADDIETVATMQRHQERLREVLAGGGITLTDMDIRHDT